MSFNKNTNSSNTCSSNDSLSIAQLFRTYGRLKNFEKHAFIYQKNDISKAAYFIEEGLVKICQFTDEGKDVTFFIRKPNEAFGLAEIVLDTPHPCYAQCLRNSKIWVLDSHVFHDVLESDPIIMKEVLYTLTNRLIHHQLNLELIVAKSASWRLASLLNQLSITNAQGEKVVELMLTQEELSNVVGCSRQTISELLSKWRSDGIIEHDRKKNKKVLKLVKIDEILMKNYGV
ncbi:Crp/Fnr family transcriptional regulator [Oceanobacillus polygoni]|uniref:CRP/FNR family transcriptional regulator n=1 Tax=Oceanobacillus polygoni TaxID=1235259 RepID=A0A9X0YT82_9BACI|nr:Crp/Fnr family transcriptional regulator [Oceanobacillus polygoni]MBP2076880.1 CRP/FNR family transcriptional regulator [Oceanobacillus polygoni]